MNDFISELEKVLKEKAPELTIRLNSVGCQRFCPPNRLSLVISHPQKAPAGRLTMTREATVQSAALEIMNWLKS